METTEISKTAIPKEVSDAAVNFVGSFSKELDKLPHRIAGSEEETACARMIRSRLHSETDADVRLEAFRATPSLGRGVFPMFGVWFLLSYLIYYLTFIGNRLSGILVTLFAALFFLTGVGIILAIYYGDRRLKGLLKKKISYNVVSEFSKNKSSDVKDRVIVIADNHDLKHGSILKDYGTLRKLALLATPVAAALFVIFCILKMAIGTEEPYLSAKITLFVIIPAVPGVFGTASAFMHYSPFARHAKRGNGVSTCLAMATYSYFAEQPDLLPDDVKIVYASFGSENAGHDGSQAFKAAHPKFLNAYVLCIGDIAGNDIKLAEANPFGKKQFSTQMTLDISSATHDIGMTLTTVPHRTLSQKLENVHGFMSAAFAESGIHSTTLIGCGDGKPDEEDISKLFSLTVGTVFNLFKSVPPIADDNKDQPPIASGMEIKSVTVK